MRERRLALEMVEGGKEQVNVQQLRLQQQLGDECYLLGGGRSVCCTRVVRSYFLLQLHGRAVTHAHTHRLSTRLT